MLLFFFTHFTKKRKKNAQTIRDKMFVRGDGGVSFHCCPQGPPRKQKLLVAALKSLSAVSIIAFQDWNL